MHRDAGTLALNAGMDAISSDKNENGSGFAAFVLDWLDLWY